MANRFLEAGERRAAKVHDLFAAIAPRYDFINDLQSFGLHRRWKRRLVTLAGAAPGVRALDLCCGTGDVCFALAAAGCDVTGLDFSEPMLSVARARAQTHGRETGVHNDGAPSVRFVSGDALNPPFADDEFDLVTISYGLRNLADMDRALAGMKRLIKPGGRALVLDFGKPDNALLRAGYFAYLRWIVPVFGWLFCGDAATHGYILDSLRQYPGQRGVQERMRAVGFVETRIVNLLGGIMSINVGAKPPLEPRKGGSGGGR